jgi:predicted GNAT family acetyltransferase
MDRTPVRNRQRCGGAGHDDGDECRRAGRDELAREIAAIPDAVRDNPTLSRFELDANGVTAVAKYKITGSVITFTHTEVPPQARGGSIASRLIAGRAASRSRARTENRGALFVRQRLSCQTPRVSPRVSGSGGLA